jgi:hypothetical protein
MTTAASNSVAAVMLGLTTALVHEGHKLRHGYRPTRVDIVVVSYGVCHHCTVRIRMEQTRSISLDTRPYDAARAVPVRETQAAQSRWNVTPADRK